MYVDFLKALGANPQQAAYTETYMALKTKVVDAGVDYDIRAMEKPSDHAPTWIELELGNDD